MSIKEETRTPCYTWEMGLKELPHYSYLPLVKLQEATAMTDSRSSARTPRLPQPTQI